MKQLLEAGIHFGHQTKRWNPKMSRYIYTERNGIYVLDLQQTLKLLEVAYNYVRDLSASGGNVLFIGTKRQAQDAIAQQAQRCGSPYVNHRWLGGTLTNFQTIRKRIEYLEELDEKFRNDEFPGLTKKEILLLSKKHDKLKKYFNGIRNMDGPPDLLFIVDLKKEHNAVREARKLGIPIAAILDTNCDPDDADIPIPGNDDAVKAISLFCETIANAVIEGREGRDFDTSYPAETSTEESADTFTDIDQATTVEIMSDSQAGTIA